MLRKLIASIVLFSMARLCFAQQPVENASKRILAFRMESWKAAHFEDTAKASQHAEVLKQLGCEVKTLQHNGHTDVECRTVLWQSLALDTQEQINQWQAWLTTAGFETLHGYRPGPTKQVSTGGPVKEIVAYRLTDWKAQHAHQPQQLSQYLALYRALGCETQQVEHAGHTDVRVRCSEWMEVELPTHEAAHKWQAFLRTAGFETSHQH